MEPDSTKRFSSRVVYYRNSRPRYPLAIIDLLVKEVKLVPEFAIADIGSGTGISSELFLRNGNLVFGVEPNDEMRMAAEGILRKYPNFRSTGGKAEATNLPTDSVDLITCGQSFHWFDVEKTKIEFLRILKSKGFVVLFWNVRRIETSLFLKAYEKLVKDFGTNYEQVRYQNVKDKGNPSETVSDTVLGQFFGKGGFHKMAFENLQLFDFEGLKGRLLSSSYAPMAGQPKHEEMISELARIFNEFQINGEVQFEYDTKVYWGQLE